MAIDDKIRYEKLQCDINREAAKISAVSSGRTDKYEYLTGKEILPSNQSRMIEHVKFNYSPLGKVLEKQTNKEADWCFEVLDELKQFESGFPKNQLNDLIIDKLKEIIYLQIKIKLDDLE